MAGAISLGNTHILIPAYLGFDLLTQHREPQKFTTVLSSAQSVSFHSDAFSQIIQKRTQQIHTNIPHDAYNAESVFSTWLNSWSLIASKKKGKKKSFITSTTSGPIV